MNVFGLATVTHRKTAAKGYTQNAAYLDENRDLVVRTGQIDIRLIWGMRYSMIRFSYRSLVVLVVFVVLIG